MLKFCRERERENQFEDIRIWIKFATSDKNANVFEEKNSVILFYTDANLKELRLHFVSASLFRRRGEQSTFSELIGRTSGLCLGCCKAAEYC
jgi:hypothetical protein